MRNILSSSKARRERRKRKKKRKKNVGERNKDYGFEDFFKAQLRAVKILQGGRAES